MKKILRFLKEKIYYLIFILLYFFSTRKTTSVIEKLPCDKIFRLDIPTYDGSGQCVHPSLLKMSNAPIYLLAFTPYTNTIDKVENPSLVISDDGLHFFEERKGLNPLVPAPPVDHNDDPVLFFSNNKYKILYLETMRPEVQNLVLLESEDRLKWKRIVLHQEFLGRKNSCFMLSPKYLRVNDLTYIFYVNRDCINGYKIEYLCGDNLDSLDYGKSKQLILPDVRGFPWHLDVINYNGCYYMLLTVAEDLNHGSYYSLRILRSNNLFDWRLCDNFKIKDCYKSTGFIENGIFYIYISKIFMPCVRRKKWKILLIKKKLNHLSWC